MRSRVPAQCERPVGASLLWLIAAHLSLEAAARSGSSRTAPRQRPACTPRTRPLRTKHDAAFLQTAGSSIRFSPCRPPTHRRCCRRWRAHGPAQGVR
eukprot:3466751-Pleurochrysis_carterae.AAC.1